MTELAQGLGLDLAVRAHGGRVTVESTVDQGSRFTVHIPVRRLAAARS